MRSSTFALSFLVHVAALGGLMFVRIFAATELPDPPVEITFIVAAPETPSPPPAPVERAPRRSATPAVHPDATPLVEPTTIAPEPAELPDTAPPGAGAIIGIAAPDGDPLGDAPPAPAIVRPPDPPEPVRPGGVVRSPQKVHHVAPVYPEIARSARVEGIVFIEALIGEDGTVRDVKVIRSRPLLDAAAVDAVRQWRFTPTLLNGVPVQVLMTVTVNFALR